MRTSAQSHYYDNRKVNINVLRRLLPYLKTMRYRVIIALLLLALAKIATVAIPITLKGIIDSLDNDVRIILPLGLLLAYGGLWLMNSLFNELRDAIFAKVRYRAMRLISTNVFRHLHTLDLSFHLNRRIGGISRDIDRGAQSVSTLLSILVFNILPSVFEVVLVIGILLIGYDLFFALTSVTTVTLYIVFTLIITNWRIKYRYQMNDLASEANTCAIDSLINYETVKYFANEEFEVSRYKGVMGKWEKVAVKTFTSMTVLNFAQSAIIGIGVTIILILAADGVVQQKLTLGDMILIQSLLLQLFLPLGILGIIYRQIKHNLIDMSNMFKLLDTKTKISDVENAAPLKITTGLIEFKNVYFSYENGSIPVLKNLSFTIKPKQKFAIVGASGVGKSSIAKLLFRLYDPNDGAIFIDGQDIKKVTIHSLRTQIAMVPQDTLMFNETIFYNIAYGAPDAKNIDVEAAAKAAYLDAFINTLPKGYSTKVGERGLKLSGGEKQRLAIARALLKHPKLFIFDEATSALDSHSEKIVQRAIDGLRENNTMLIIAHRLSTITDADCIIVLGKDGILEIGKHQVLLNKRGTYYALWQLQSQQEKKTKQIEKKDVF